METAGAILHEMVTGKRAFEGTSAASVTAAILEREPAAISSLQPLAPPALDRMVRKCLAKDPESRWQTASDAADELRWLASQPAGAASTVVPRRGQRWRVVAAAAAAVVLPLVTFALGAWLFGSRGALPSVFTLSFEMDRCHHVAVSPDGRLIAFDASDRNVAPQLYVRRLDESQPRLVASVPGRSPCFSPDGQWLGFVTGEDRRPTVWKVPVAGGPPQKIITLREAGEIKWLADGRILFSRDANGIGILNTATGKDELLVGPEDTGRRGRYVWP